MTSFMLRNIETGTLMLRKASIEFPVYLKDIGQSVSTGETLGY